MRCGAFPPRCILDFLFATFCFSFWLYLVRRNYRHNYRYIVRSGDRTDRPGGSRVRESSEAEARAIPSRLRRSSHPRGRPRRPVVVVPVISLAVISVGSLTSSHVDPDRPAKRGLAGSRPSRARHGARAPHQARRVARARSGGHGGASVTSANRVCGPEFPIAGLGFQFADADSEPCSVGAWWGSPNRLSARPRRRTAQERPAQSSRHRECVGIGAAIGLASVGRGERERYRTWRPVGFLHPVIPVRRIPSYGPSPYF